MNYKQSNKILKEIKGAKKILVNCHRGPDADSVGSALALSGILKNMGKDVSVICPSDIPQDLTFLSGAEGIKRVNFQTFDFSSYDLFLVIDSSTYSMVTGLKDSDKPSIKTIVIDHHISNEKFGEINLVDDTKTSTGELLFKIFEDWGEPISKEIAEPLLTGIIGDTGSFQYQNVGQETLRIAATLMEIGADKDKIIYNIYRNIDFGEVKMWGKIIDSMKTEKGFVWAAVPFSVFKEFGENQYAKEDAANLFFPIVKDTDFGMVMVETSEGIVSVSFRSRSGFDVSEIAKEVGGGGHKAAAGARIEGVPFNEAVDKVLTAARKYVKKT